MASNTDRADSLPALTAAALFRIKATLLQMRRAALNTLDHQNIAFRKTSDAAPYEQTLSKSKTLLWTNGNAAEKHLIAGKIHNLRRAIRQINGIVIPADQTFSFWAQIGKPGKRKGYVEGRELREGCIIPTIGGGLCQLSNALYDAALSANFEIVERHAHTQIIPGSLAELGRDATVFWNYVDLRFKSTRAFRIEAQMDAHTLTICFRGEARQNTQAATRLSGNALVSQKLNSSQSCHTCQADDCFRHIETKSIVIHRDRRAYLVDEFYPEFDQYIAATRGADDTLLLPLDGVKYGKTNYAWNTRDFHQVKQSLGATLMRAYESRKLAAQGAARQGALLKHAAKLARSYGAHLHAGITHLTIAQNLLPFLWHEGHLGGRSYDVLMTGVPLARLHEKLDAASALHPESITLADFRADDRLLRAESQALAQARQIITPHTEIADLFPHKVVLLDWFIPTPGKTRMRNDDEGAARIVFPAPTVGRKGIYELRAAMQDLNIRLITIGANLEDVDFWRGVSVEHRDRNGDWLDGADAVVLPAFVEGKPRMLLQAVAAEVPVIASTACGLAKVKGVVTIPSGDVVALREQLKQIINSRAKRPPAKFAQTSSA